MTAALVILLIVLFQSSLWKLWKYFEDMFIKAICAQHRGRGQEFKIMLMKPKPKSGEIIGFVELRCISISIFKGSWNNHSRPIGVNKWQGNTRVRSSKSHAPKRHPKWRWIIWIIDVAVWGSLSSFATLPFQGCSWGSFRLWGWVS